MMTPPPFETVEQSGTRKEPLIFNHLLKSGFSKDGDLVHKSGVSVPYHLFIIEWQMSFYSYWGKKYNSTDELLETYSQLDLTRQEFEIFWKTIYGDFESQLSLVNDAFADNATKASLVISLLKSVIPDGLVCLFALYELTRNVDLLKSVQATILDNVEKILYRRSIGRVYYDGHTTTARSNVDDIDWRAIGECFSNIIHLLMKFDHSLGSDFSISLLNNIWGSIVRSENTPTVAQMESVLTILKDSGKFDMIRIMAILCTPLPTSLPRITRNRSGARQTESVSPVLQFRSLIAAKFTQYAYENIFQMKKHPIRDEYKLQIPGPNFVIKISESDVSYRVHDFILAEWSYFAKAMSSNLEETQSRTLSLPTDFNPRVLQLVLGLLYCVDIESSISIGKSIWEIDPPDLSFFLHNSIEYGFVGFPHENSSYDLPSSLQSTRFDDTDPIQKVAAAPSVPLPTFALKDNVIDAFKEASKRLDFNPSPFTLLLQSNSPRMARLFDRTYNRLFNISEHRDQLMSRFGQIQFIGGVEGDAANVSSSTISHVIKDIALAMSFTHVANNPHDISNIRVIPDQADLF